MLKELNLEKYIKNNFKLKDFKFIKVSNRKKGALGIGSFATVNLAQLKSNNELYALKQVNIREKNVKVDKENLRREVLIHRHLRHENIIKFYDLFEDEGKIYIVIEYAKNGNLFYFLHKHKRFNEIDAFKYWYQTLLAVKYMHEKRLVHRDLKPENILLDKYNNIKLCDFGWSTVRGKQEKMRTFCGTYEYMAPELLARKSYDYTVDIWALGILLYELMHGYSPYRAKGISEIAANIKAQKMRFSRRLSKEVKDLVSGILQVKPEQRLSLEEIINHPWVQKYVNIQKMSKKQSPAPAKKSTTRSANKILKHNKENLHSSLMKKLLKQNSSKKTTKPGKIQNLYEKTAEQLRKYKNSPKNITSLFKITETEELKNRQYAVPSNKKDTSVSKSKNSRVNKKQSQQSYLFSKPTPLNKSNFTPKLNCYERIFKEYGEQKIQKTPRNIEITQLSNFLKNKKQNSDLLKSKSQTKLKLIDLDYKTENYKKSIKTSRVREKYKQPEKKKEKQKNIQPVNNISFSKINSRKNSLLDLLSNARKVRRVQKVENQQQFKRCKSSKIEQQFSVLRVQSPKQRQQSRQQSIMRNMSPLQAILRNQSPMQNALRQQSPNQYQVLRNRSQNTINKRDVNTLLRQQSNIHLFKTKQENNRTKKSIKSVLRSRIKTSRTKYTNNSFQYSSRELFKFPIKEKKVTKKSQKIKNHKKENNNILSKLENDAKTKKYFDDETNRIIAKYIKQDNKGKKVVKYKENKAEKYKEKSPHKDLIKNNRDLIQNCADILKKVNNRSQIEYQPIQPKRWELLYNNCKSLNKSGKQQIKYSQITPRKKVKQNVISTKKNCENIHSGLSSTKKEVSRVLNLKDMNNKTNQLNQKINHCFGDFYKKLDTFADTAKSKSEKHRLYQHYSQIKIQRF